MYSTINDKFFMQGIIHFLCTYTKGFHNCQLSRNENLPTRHLQTSIILNYRSLCRLNVDLKVMPRLNKGHKYMLCIIDEVTNYLITVLKHQSRSEEIGYAIIENVITKYCVPDYIIYVTGVEIGIQNSHSGSCLTDRRK